MINKETAEHYQWGQACDGWHLVKQEGALSVIQERMPPGTSEVLHYHRHARQFFFVLSGTATMLAGDTTETLPSHSGIEIPPGQPHQVRNNAAEPLEFLLVSMPPSHGDRVTLS
jgi:mannose-6-phosphate isomerase-like protein (cupin superfamily)